MKWILDIPDERFSQDQLEYLANQLGLQVSGRRLSGPYQQLVTALGLTHLMKVDAARLMIEENS